MTADYSLTLQDASGRSVVLHINGASIDEQIAAGTPEWEAREIAEGNAFGNSIARGDIGAEAWLAE